MDHKQDDPYSVTPKGESWSLDRKSWKQNLRLETSPCASVWRWWLGTGRVLPHLNLKGEEKKYKFNLSLKLISEEPLYVCCNKSSKTDLFCSESCSSCQQQPVLRLRCSLVWEQRWRWKGKAHCPHSASARWSPAVENKTWVNYSIRQEETQKQTNSLETNLL